MSEKPASNLLAQYRWYMLGVTSFVIPMGIQTVLLPWLIAVQLQESVERLGIAQMVSQLPALFLILLGGLVADKNDPRKILISCHLLGAIPATFLAVAIYSGHLSYELTIVFALMTSIVAAFMQPARDGLLNRVAGNQLQRTVTVTMGLTFGAQIVGFGAASFAESIGAVSLLSIHALLILSGAFMSLQLKPAPPVWLRSNRTGFSQIKEGLKLVYRSPRMFPAFIVMVSLSIFYGGSFAVLNPIIVRDIYSGGAKEISLSYSAFMIGTILMTIILVASGELKMHGRAMMLAIFIGGLCLLAAATGLSFYGYLTAIFLWGNCGAIAMSMGRTIMQESAPEQYRARVLSVFSLGNMGGMPLGTLLMGFCASVIGPLSSLVVAVLGMWFVLTAVWVSSDLSSLKPINESP